MAKMLEMKSAQHHNDIVNLFMAYRKQQLKNSSSALTALSTQRVHPLLHHAREQNQSRVLSLRQSC
jgi:hypothetical protein